MRLFVISILLILAVGIFFGFTRPILDDIALTNKDIASYDEALGNAKKFISVRDGLLAKYNQLPAEGLARLDKLLPDTIDNVRLIIDINGIAKNDGLTLKGLQVTGGPSSGQAAQKTTGGRAYDSVMVGFSTSSDFQTFRKFISDLEHSLRLVDLADLSLSANDKGLYDFNVQLRTYWLK
jgi:hypothetical protein